MENRKSEKQRPEPLKSKLISAEASEPGRYMGDRRDFCLLQLLQAFQLIRLHPALVLTPVVKRHFADADLSNSIRNGQPLAMQNINLPEFRDDLFRLVAFLYHLGSPLNRILIQGRSVA